MTDKSRDHAEELSESAVRIDHLIWLPSLVTLDGHASVPAFDEFVDEALDGYVEIEALPEIEATLELAEQEDMDATEFAEELLSRLAFNRRNGFLAKIGTPYTYNHRDGGFTFTWGHYRTIWIYAKSLDNLTDQAVAWAKVQHEADRAKEAGKKAETQQEKQ